MCEESGAETRMTFNVTLELGENFVTFEGKTFFQHTNIFSRMSSLMFACFTFKYAK